MIRNPDYNFFYFFLTFFLFKTFIKQSNNSTNTLTNKQKQSYNIKDELIILYSMYIGL